MYLTLGTVKNRLNRYVDGGRCATDSAVTDRINEAIELLVVQGKFKGLVALYDFYVYNRQISLPSEIETILGVGIDGKTYPIANKWYEFKGSGSGVWSGDKNNYGHHALDRGDHSTFYDLTENKNVSVQSDSSEAAGLEFKVYGYDENGVYKDGHSIPITSGVSVSSISFSHVRRVEKPTTAGTVYFYAENSDGTQNLLGIYRPWDTQPLYRRYLIPAVKGGCEKQCAHVVAKRRFLPVRQDSDILLIQNFNALRLAVIAIEKLNKGEAEAEVYEQKALRLLTKESGEHDGDSSSGTLNIQNSNFASCDLTAII